VFLFIDATPAPDGAGNLTWRPIGSYTPEFDFCGAERIKDKHVARQQEVSERRKRLQSASSASRWTL